jgi:hypothetical protein
MRVIQFFVLAEYWNFWALPTRHPAAFGNGAIDLTALSKEAMKGGLAAKGCTILNEWSVIGGIFVGLLVSAFALSDQLEREVPSGAFPRRFSRALAASPSGLVWTVVFLFGFFVDLFLRFAVIVPIAMMLGLSWGFLICFLWILVPILTSWWIMNEKNTLPLEQAGKAPVKTMPAKFSSMKGRPGRRGSDVISIQTSSLHDPAETKTPDRSANLRNQSDSENSKTPTPRGRSNTDQYDDGMLLDSFTVPLCCGCCSRSSRCDKMVETMPFMLWGMWVDLPMRLKWLRLRDGHNDSKNVVCCGKEHPKSCVYYWMTSLISVVAVVVVYVKSVFIFIMLVVLVV